MKREAPGLYWVESEALTAILFISCKQDVAVERELHQRLTSLPKSEQAAWVLESEINDRGVRIDVPLATAAAKLVAQALVELHARVCHETGGAVPAATQVKKLKEWLRQQGIVLPRRLKKSKEGPRLEHCLEADDILKLLAGNLSPAGEVHDCTATERFIRRGKTHGESSIAPPTHCQHFSRFP